MKTAIIIANERKSEIVSSNPTVLHKIIDKPMIKKIVDNFNDLKFNNIISIIDDDMEKIIDCLEDKCKFEKVSGSVSDLKAISKLEYLKNNEGYTIVTQGNSPLITKETYELLLETVQDFPMVVMTAAVDVDKGYDIIIRNPSRMLRSILKYEDASIDQKAIKEVNMNIYAFDNKLLFKYIEHLEEKTSNYDFTDLVQEFKDGGHRVMPIMLDDFGEAIRIESRRDLVYANNWERERINNFWLDNGVTILNSDSTIIGSDVVIGNDTVIYPNNYIFGKTKIGKNNVLKQDNTINDSLIGSNNKIVHSMINKTEMQDNNTVGPWANIRENVKIGNTNRIGSYVELKKTEMKDHNAIAHNTYLGDTLMGSHNNIGWGVVTANYNGHTKSVTKIADNSFIGSSSTLIAPVNIGSKVLVAAGSTITDDVNDNDMAIARKRQRNIEERGKLYLERGK